MKGLIKRIAAKAGRLGRRWARHADSPYRRKQLDLLTTTHQTGQLLLAGRYRDLAAAADRSPLGFREVEFRCFSQFGEDGILLYLFSLLGTTNRRAVEICAGDGIECNTANLIVNHGWEGLLFDGDAARLAEGASFYRECPETWIMPPKLVHAWITAENVNRLIAENGFSGAIDLLSLDMDGVDYWIWKALDAVVPRVVVLEFNNLWGPDEPMTVPYSADFRSSGARGASLAAFVKLGREKGYRLVGAHRHGFNAFFIRDGLGEIILPEVSAASCLDNPFTRIVQSGRNFLLERGWVRV